MGVLSGLKLSTRSGIQGDSSLVGVIVLSTAGLDKVMVRAVLQVGMHPLG